MGMFSSLFGSSGSDKADKMRQHAIDAFNAIKTPQLQDLQVRLDKEVSAGVLTPEQAEAQLLGSNAFNSIATDPSLTGAAKQALTQLQQIGTQGGLTAIDKAQLQDITNETNQLAKSRNESIMQNARERGIGGSGLEIANRLQNEQSVADRAAMAGTNVAANAEQRALDAIKAAGGLGQSLESQAYGEQAQKAQAQNAIDLFNAQTGTATNLYNTGTANQAQAENLANAQNIANTNTGISNQNKLYNAQQNQQIYNDELAKAQGIAGVYNKWADDSTAQAKNETAADMSLLGGALKTGAAAGGFALGSPAGGMAASGAMDIGGGRTTNKNANEMMLPGGYKGGVVKNYAEGGEVVPNENRGMSPDHAEPENKFSHECFSDYCLHPEHEMDIQPPLNENKSLSEAEAEPENKSLEDEYNDFIKKYAYGGSVKMADGGMVTIKSASKEPKHTTPPHAEGYDIGGLVNSDDSKNSNIINTIGNSLEKASTAFGVAPSEQSNSDDSDDMKLKLAALKASMANSENQNDNKNSPLFQRLGQLIGSHADIASEIDKNTGGMIHDFRSGGKVPGVAKVHGDSPKNDIVPAKLSPGEIVLPRSVVQNPVKAPNFISKTLSREDPTSVALKRLRQAHLNQGA